MTLKQKEITRNIYSPTEREFQLIHFLEGKLKYESGERRAESGERRADSGKFRFCWIILGEAVPISVKFDIFVILYLEMLSIAMDIITQFF